MAFPISFFVDYRKGLKNWLNTADLKLENLEKILANFYEKNCPGKDRESIKELILILYYLKNTNIIKCLLENNFDDWFPLSRISNDITGDVEKTDDVSKLALAIYAGIFSGDIIKAMDKGIELDTFLKKEFKE